MDTLIQVQHLLEKYKAQLRFERNLFIANGDMQSLKSEAATIGIAVTMVMGELELDVRSFLGEPLIFWERMDQQLNAIKAKEEYIVLDKTGEWFRHAVDGTVAFSSNAADAFRKRIMGYYHYYRLYHFLTAASFADHHNGAGQQIVLYSSAKGIFKINYGPVGQVQFPSDLAQRVDALIEVAKTTELKSFVKNAIISVSGNAEQIVMQELINQLPVIVDTSRRDYELVSKQFDFTKFRDSLYAEKEKYVSSIREVINKIFSQAVGIPISISATVFATYKVSDDVFMLLLAGAAFVLYLIFYVKIQLVYRSDLIDIRSGVDRDFAIIASASGLPAAVVKQEEDSLRKKLRSSISMTGWMIAVVIALGLLVCLYVLYGITRFELSALGEIIRSLLKK